MFLCDLYSKAEYLALIDGDAVLGSAGQRSLLFDTTSGALRPYVHGSYNYPIFVHAVEALGLAWVAEFMEAQPFVFRALDLPFLRAFIAQRLDFGPSVDFADVFTELFKQVQFKC